MKKNLNPLAKVYASLVLIVISISMMVTVTFAWFTLSTAPEVGMIQVSIGGDNTIMVAPNIVTTYSNEDGAKVVNYPGKFTKNLDFNEYSQYEAAINTPLIPVSTADGLNWFLPKIDENGNEIVVTSLDDYMLDSTYKYANNHEGGFSYLDFWVLSPLDDIVVRISAGELNREQGIITENGSYAIQLPQSVKDSTSLNGYSLVDSNQSLAASIRIGFMSDMSDTKSNEPMLAYVASNNYLDDIMKLRGSLNGENSNFLVFEPNGTLHTNEESSIVLSGNRLDSVSSKNGEYWITYPIGINENGDMSLMSIASSMIVQKTSNWKRTEDEALILDDIFQAYLSKNKIDNKSLVKCTNDFFKSMFPNGYMQYVNSGCFFEDVYYLYLSSKDSKRVAKDTVESLPISNVVPGSYIVRLEKNVPQRVRMFIWMEGQDVDCGSGAADQQIAIRLELAGSSGE